MLNLPEQAERCLAQQISARHICTESSHASRKWRCTGRRQMNRPSPFHRTHALAYTAPTFFSRGFQRRTHPVPQEVQGHWPAGRPDDLQSFVEGFGGYIDVVYADDNIERLNQLAHLRRPWRAIRVLLEPSDHHPMRGARRRRSIAIRHSFDVKKQRLLHFESYRVVFPVCRLGAGAWRTSGHGKGNSHRPPDQRLAIMR